VIVPDTKLRPFTKAKDVDAPQNGVDRSASQGGVEENLFGSGALAIAVCTVSTGSRTSKAGDNVSSGGIPPRVTSTGATTAVARSGLTSIAGSSAGSSAAITIVLPGKSIIIRRTTESTSVGVSILVNLISFAP